MKTNTYVLKVIQIISKYSQKGKMYIAMEFCINIYEYLQLMTSQ